MKSRRRFPGQKQKFFYIILPCYCILAFFLV